MKHSNSANNGEINVFADSHLFSESTIMKCLYWFGDKFHTEVTAIDNSTYLLVLKSLGNHIFKDDELAIYMQKLERDLIDFQLRDIISKETANVRDLLVAKAFSNGEFDEKPPGNVSDPVGFSINP